MKVEFIGLDEYQVSCMKRVVLLAAMCVVTLLILAISVSVGFVSFCVMGCYTLRKFAICLDLDKIIKGQYYAVERGNQLLVVSGRSAWKFERVGVSLDCVANFITKQYWS